MSTTAFYSATRRGLALLATLALLLRAGTGAAQAPTQRDLDYARTLEACKLPNELIRRKPAHTTQTQRE